MGDSRWEIADGRWQKPLFYWCFTPIRAAGPILFRRVRVGASPVCDNIYPPRRPNLTPKLKRQDAKTPRSPSFLPQMKHRLTQIKQRQEILTAKRRRSRKIRTEWFKRQVAKSPRTPRTQVLAADETQIKQRQEILAAKRRRSRKIKTEWFKHQDAKVAKTPSF